MHRDRHWLIPSLLPLLTKRLLSHITRRHARYLSYARYCLDVVHHPGLHWARRGCKHLTLSA